MPVIASRIGHKFSGGADGSGTGAPVIEVEAGDFIFFIKVPIIKCSIRSSRIKVFIVPGVKSYKVDRVHGNSFASASCFGLMALKGHYRAEFKLVIVREVGLVQVREVGSSINRPKGNSKSV
jgi:hypothetical protein